ncbi:D-alanyl-D-alanine carboxypeptidase [Massilimicrobiota sp. An142]|uniref:Serine hydrolase n=1 Tax=Massilimicrobiota timonensis TaxID=1776392 RepID=A0ABT7UII2_9FIRM|nr:MULTISPECIES: serine hydrolase [Massilimicrobiota]MEE0779344.1 serine hydrolase [Massilimicrobiota sp.]HJA53688.1 serine hydrolase [Candidatus Massilimicrobiota merdigallinarum]MDM8195951.1 serine hydrolase [Massilimicrobiota timonensis]OUN34086.1 D-alanyl-D-alanine carboxypeptidase [Massilimicrobiota sp. An80]OUQ13246.1 D-alanyl-D-alanine carboxypeptidase [Massilimicrobiota sp. An142]
MKKIMFFLCFLLCIVNVHAVDFQGQSYIVMESTQHNVLEGKNIHEVQSVASISKIMTAIVAIENGQLDDEYEIGEEVNEAWGSGIYIHIGDRINLRDLLHGLLLRSGNDAANVIAKNVGGSIEHFVEMMNQKAQELHMTDTHFSNPTGLDEEDDGNQSSVYDMALLMSYCSQNPIFNDIVMKETYKREDGGGTWHNKNRLLEEYEYCVGGKTGYTKKAKRTLVTRAIKDDVSLVIVTFNCGNDFEFHQKKYEECFQKYQNVLVLSKGIYQYHGHSFLIDQDLYYCGQESQNVSLQSQGDILKVYVNENPIYEVNQQNALQMIFQYAWMLFGECMNG